MLAVSKTWLVANFRRVIWISFNNGFFHCIFNKDQICRVHVSCGALQLCSSSQVNTGLLTESVNNSPCLVNQFRKTTMSCQVCSCVILFSCLDYGSNITALWNVQISKYCFITRSPSPQTLSLTYGEFLHVHRAFLFSNQPMRVYHSQGDITPKTTMGYI